VREHTAPEPQKFPGSAHALPGFLFFALWVLQLVPLALGRPVLSAPSSARATRERIVQPFREGVANFPIEPLSFNGRSDRGPNKVLVVDRRKKGSLRARRCSLDRLAESYLGIAS
jgi:hypothetical protein